jgi:cytochrome P450
VREGFVAFFTGARACLGKQVALLEIAVVAAALVRSYAIHPVLSRERSSEWTTRVTCEFKYPTPFRFVRRK